MRLYPPGVVSARKVIRDLWFNGHRIRAGRLLLFSPYVTHRLPELWPEPHQFRPERWDPDSPDYREPGPHGFLPFSGGPHRCIGSAMATTELTVMFARLLARTSLRLLTSPKCSWSKPIAQHGRDERPPPDRWITRLVAGAVTLVVVVGALVIANFGSCGHREDRSA